MMKKMAAINNFPLLIVAFLVVASSVAYAFDPGPLQDFCVAVPDKTVPVFVNGRFCQNPKDVAAGDFFFSSLDVPGNTSNPSGSAITVVAVDQLPGLNTLGISLVRIDYAPYGINPPHTNPRGTKILTVLEGTLYAGFLTANENKASRLFAKILKKGDVFVFPIGLVQFQYNIGNTNAVAISAFNSQNPGQILIPSAIFGSKPPINPDFLAKSFRLNKNIIDYLQKVFGSYEFTT